MHIADGVLPVSVSLVGYALTLAGVGYSLRRLDSANLPKVAVVTSSFFVASLVHLPLGPTSVHLLLPGIVGALLGPAAFLSITIGLFLQSILFQFGGLTALGANNLMMGLPALLAGLLLAALLATAGEDFWGVAKLAVAAHVPVMLIEGGVGGCTVAFLFQVKPELLAVQSFSGPRNEQ